MTQQFELYIDGQWQSAPRYADNINPSNTSDCVGQFAQGDAELIDQAVQAAARAAESWSQSPIQQRADLLDAMGNKILQRADELGRLLAREEGKPLAEAKGEVARAGQIFKFFGGEALRITGDKLASVRPGLEVDVTREAVGVVGLITPWNFPIAIPAWKLAPALAFGNTAVLKPSELTPACAHALASIADECGFPAGVINVVNGEGDAGAALAAHPLVDAVSFTGSVGTGEKIRIAAATRGAAVQCEMGGKNPWLVMDDADLNVAVDCALNSAFFSAGQRCTASSRLLVHQSIHDRFVAALTEKLQALTIGAATADGTEIGPLASAAQLEKSLRYIDIAKAEGAHIAVGGDALMQEKGYYLQPTLLTACHNDMQHCQEEIFGPVASVIKVADFEEGLALCNATAFGLSAGIATDSLKYTQAFRRRVKAGMVMVNLPTAGVDYHVPFGGVKGSSYGSREQGRYAQEFYTTVKTHYIG